MIQLATAAILWRRLLSCLMYDLIIFVLPEFCRFAPHTYVDYVIRD